MDGLESERVRVNERREKREGSKSVSESESE